jgi:hypothetical protein
VRRAAKDLPPARHQTWTLLHIVGEATWATESRPRCCFSLSTPTGCHRPQRAAHQQVGLEPWKVKIFQIHSGQQNLGQLYQASNRDYSVPVKLLGQLKRLLGQSCEPQVDGRHRGDAGTGRPAPRDQGRPRGGARAALYRRLQARGARAHPR